MIIIQILTTKGATLILIHIETLTTKEATPILIHIETLTTKGATPILILTEIIPQEGIAIHTETILSLLIAILYVLVIPIEEGMEMVLDMLRILILTDILKADTVKAAPDILEAAIATVQEELTIQIQGTPNMERVQAILSPAMMNIQKEQAILSPAMMNIQKV